MTTFWTEKKMAMYEDACHFLNYPEIPLGSFFKEVIRPGDTVMDIGCGPGVVSLYLASLCKTVTAVDPDEAAVEFLKRRAREKDVANVEVVHSKWPDFSLHPCDVTVMLYVFKALDTPEKVSDFLKMIKRSGIILEPVNQKSFYKPLYQYLEIEKKSKKDVDKQLTIELLRAAGADVRSETIIHDFGQPVDNIDEAAKFIWQKLHVGEEYYQKVREVVEDYTETRQGRLYVPNERVSTLIIFDK